MNTLQTVLAAVLNNEDAAPGAGSATSTRAPTRPAQPRPRTDSDTIPTETLPPPPPKEPRTRHSGGSHPDHRSRVTSDSTVESGSGSARPAEAVGSAEVWQLVEQAQAGDVEAFGKIYDRYLDTVFRYVYFRVGSRTLAEDLTQEAFLRALRRINSFTWQGRDLGAWLVTIARNLVADHFKSGRYRLEMSTSEVLDADREDRAPEGSPESAVVNKLTNRTLLEAVQRLGAEQQECIVLRFLHGFSVAETARAMGKNEGAIKALQYRAVRALARLLPEGFTP